MLFSRATLDTYSPAAGVVVVIDVIRAFTTAAFAFGAGAGQILLVESVEDALALCRRFPDARIMGEVGGRRPPGFDLGNSPAALRSAHYPAQRFIQRTSAGTQGVVRVFSPRPGGEKVSEGFLATPQGVAKNPSEKFSPSSRREEGAGGWRGSSLVLAASFPVAAATAGLIRRLDPPQVTFLITGIFPGGYGDEDVALADYLQALLLPGPAPHPAPYLQRVRDSLSGRKLFNDPADPDFLPADLDCCTDLDRFPFALPVKRQDDLLVMERRE